MQTTVLHQNIILSILPFFNLKCQFTIDLQTLSIPGPPYYFVCWKPIKCVFTHHILIVNNVLRKRRKLRHYFTGHVCTILQKQFYFLVSNKKYKSKWYIKTCIPTSFLGLELSMWKNTKPSYKMSKKNIWVRSLGFTGEEKKIDPYDISIIEKGSF